MVFIGRTLICFALVLPVLLPCSSRESYRGYIYHDDQFGLHQDMTTRRENTLYDDADDLQPQLDNEFREKLSHLKTTWMWSSPAHFPFANWPSTTPSVLIVKLQKRNNISKDHTRHLFKRQIIRRGNPQSQTSRTMHNGILEHPKSKSSSWSTLGGVYHINFFGRYQDKKKRNPKMGSGKNLYDHPLGGDNQLNKLSAYDYNEPSQYRDGETEDYLYQNQYTKQPDEWAKYHNDLSNIHQDNENPNDIKDCTPSNEYQNHDPIGENTYDGLKSVTQDDGPSTPIYEFSADRIYFDYYSGDYKNDEPYNANENDKPNDKKLYEDIDYVTMEENKKNYEVAKIDDYVSKDQIHKISKHLKDDNEKHKPISVKITVEPPHHIHVHHKYSFPRKIYKTSYNISASCPASIVSIAQSYNETIKEPANSNLEPPNSSLEPATNNLEPVNSDLEPANSNMEPATNNMEPVNSDLEPANSNLEPATNNLEPVNSDLEPANSNLEPATNNLEPVNITLEPANSNLEPATNNLEPATDNLEPASHKNGIDTTTSAKTTKPTGTDETLLSWDFSSQLQWHESFKDCKGTRQSPIDLSPSLLRHGRGFQNIVFAHYDTVPKKLTFTNDGKRVYVQGDWKKSSWPLVYGGALFSRKYLFHSMSFYWPSEHTIEGFNFPLECQLLHIAAEYPSYTDALTASTFDPNAFLGIVNIFKYEKTHAVGGMQLIIDLIKQNNSIGDHNMKPIPLAHFSPPFLEYVCYHGSLTTPPCTEAVFWIINRRSLAIRREEAAAVSKVARDNNPPSNIFIRMTQPVNDRKMYIFYKKPGSTSPVF